MSNISNLLSPIRSGKPNSASALETGNVAMAQWGWSILAISVRYQQSLGSLWRLHDAIVPMLKQNLVGIGPNTEIFDYAHVSWRVFKALAKVRYWGRIRGSKFKSLPNVYFHCAVTAARKCVIFHICKNNYTDFIIGLINCRNLTFTHFAHSPDLSKYRKFEMLLCVWGHWAMTAGPKYVRFHKLEHMQSGCIPDSRYKKTSPVGFAVYWIKNYFVQQCTQSCNICHQ